MKKKLQSATGALCFLLLFAGLFLRAGNTRAQTILSPGDIVFTGYNSNASPSAGDTFSLVLLKAISAGTQISVTDRGYMSGSWQPAGSTEGTVTWTAGTALPLGTEVYFCGLQVRVYDPLSGTYATNGTAMLTEGSSANGLSISNVGDQFIAFQGGGGSVTGGGVTFIAGLHFFICPGNTTTAGWDNGGCTLGPNSSDMPPGLTGGVNAFYTGALPGNVLAKLGRFNCTGTPAATANDIRTAVMNQANWTLSDQVSPFPMPSRCIFISSLPVVTAHPANRTICNGANTTFSVTASGATSFQWQQNSGSGYTNLSNGAPYSGVTTSTLTISPGAMAQNGYLYRCVVTNASGSVNSNGATLTVISISTSGSQTDISCNGGSNGTATVNVSGGSAPYSYSWSPSGGTNATAGGLSAGTYTVTISDNNSCQATRSFTINEPTAFSISTAKTDVSCNGGTNGTATVNVSGGSAPYSYSWSPSGGTNATAGGLSAGTYTVTISDNNSCQATRSFTINEPSAFSISTAKTDVSCNGGTNGTATVNVSGGSAPYSYSWSPSGGTNATAGGLSAGTYTVTISDNNSCQATRSFTINEPSAFSISTAKTDVSCNGGTNGTATVNVSGGSAPYSYSWSPSGGTNATAGGLSAGTYTVTITDNNSCQATRSITVNEPSALSVIETHTDVSCNGGTNGTATVNVSGGASPYSYSWSPSGGTNATAGGLSAGTYTVTITDNNNCQVTRSITVNEPVAMNIIASHTDVSCNGGTNGTATVNVSGGASPYSYSWSPSGGTNATAGGLSAGTYTVTVTDGNSCQSTRSITINEPSALMLNPSHTDVSCNGGSNGTATVSVSGGASPYSYSWSPSGGTNATAGGLGAGIYTVTVTDNNSCQATQSITITEPVALSANMSAHTDVSCNGGSDGTATVSVSGGTTPYSYSWSPSGGTNATASGLGAGTYTVTVADNNNCQVTQSVTLTEPSAMSVIDTHTDVSCNGGTDGTATVNVSGGTAPYSYSWSPSGGSNATAGGLSAGIYTATITDNNNCQVTRSITVSEPVALNISGSHTDVSCNGDSSGTATISVSGGTMPYTYSWSPYGGTDTTATNLLAGTYTVTVTDGHNCQSTQGFTISEPAALTVTPASANVSCAGGADGYAAVDVSGGTAPYTYSWSQNAGLTDSVGALAAGSYMVVITDDNQCVISSSFVISEPAPLSVQTGHENVSCGGNGSDGQATVSVSGGTSPYTYSWSPGGFAGDTLSGLIPGMYTIHITDANGCTYTDSVAVGGQEVFSSSQTIHICPGQSYSIGNHTYTIPDLYTDTLHSAAGCDSIVSTTLLIDSVNVNVINNDPVLMAENGQAQSYAWVDCNNGFSLISGAASQSFTAGSNGSYAVIVTNAGGCKDTSACNDIIRVSLDEAYAENTIILYPNPTTGKVTIQSADIVPVKIEVMDITGKQYPQMYNGQSLDISALQNGVYLVRITVPGGRQYTSRIVKI